MAIYAQVKNGVVVNRIVIDDVSLEPLLTEGFDSLIQLDKLKVQPDIGSLYDGKVFTPVAREQDKAESELILDEVNSKIKTVVDDFNSQIQKIPGAPPPLPDLIPDPIPNELSL